MNYEFPKITHIGDVLPHINNNPEIKVLGKDGYTVIDYVFINQDTFLHPIRKECRGIVFNDNGNLISRPFHKFFNLNEKPETQLNVIDFSKPHLVMNKMDGSMIRPVFIKDELVFMTRKGITDVAKQVTEEIQLTDYQKDFMVNCLNDHMTPLYEFISPNNKIVLEYDEPKLVLLGVRDNYTGEYYEIHSDEVFTDKVFHEVHKTINDEKGIEGYVIRFEDGHMLKLKTEDYVNLHRVLDTFDSEKNILKAILGNQTDDLYPKLPPEKIFMLEKYEEQIKSQIDRFKSIIRSGVDLFNNKDQKTFALWVNDNIRSKLRPLFFQFRKNGDEKDEQNLIEYLLKHTSSADKLEEVREILGPSWEKHRQGKIE